MSCDFADKHAYDDMIEMNQVISLQVDLNATHFWVEFFFIEMTNTRPREIPFLLPLERVLHGISITKQFTND